MLASSVHDWPDFDEIPCIFPRIREFDGGDAFAAVCQHTFPKISSGLAGLHSPIRPDMIFGKDRKNSRSPSLAICISAMTTRPNPYYPNRRELAVSLSHAWEQLGIEPNVSFVYMLDPR